MSEEPQKERWKDEQQWSGRRFIRNSWRWSVYTFVLIWCFSCGVCGAVRILELIVGVHSRSVPAGLGYGFFSIVGFVTGNFIFWFVGTNHRWDWFLGDESARERYLKRDGRIPKK
jgi:hypothetical protein